MPRPSFFDALTPIGMRLIDLDAAGERDVDDAGADERRWPGWWPAGCCRTGCRRWWPRCVSGRPAASQAVRVMLNACSPTWLTQPPTTWPISAGIDAGALDERLLHDAEQVGRVDGGQAAVAAADGGADGVDDDDVAHDVLRPDEAARSGEPSLRCRYGPCRGRSSLARAVRRRRRAPLHPRDRRDRVRRRSHRDRRALVDPLPRHARRRRGVLGGRRAARRGPVVRRGARPVLATSADRARTSGSSPGAPCSSPSGRAPTASAVAAARRPSRPAQRPVDEVPGVRPARRSRASRRR